jgi:hypothetical protein
MSDQATHAMATTDEIRATTEATVIPETATAGKKSAGSEGVTSPTSQYTNVQWVSICIAVYASAFLYGLDTTIVSVVQGTLVERFGNVEKLGWLGIGFPLGSVATLAAWAKAYGVFDVKWLYLGSLVNFAAGSALCGGAPSMNVLIIGRVWAGAGGAGMYLGYVLFLLMCQVPANKQATEHLLTKLHDRETPPLHQWWRNGMGTWKHLRPDCWRCFC